MYSTLMMLLNIVLKNNYKSTRKEKHLQKTKKWKD